MKEVLSSIILLLGLTAYVYSETCPPSQDLHPCKCEEDEDRENIKVTCDNDPSSLDDLKAILSSLSGKEDVEIYLKGLNLGKVPSDFFNGIGVEKLKISNCKLDSLTSEDGKLALSGLEETLEHLEIVSSFTEDNVPVKLKLGHLRQLRILVISDNTITELGNDWFDGDLSSLDYVVISNNGIKKVGDKVFENLSYMRLVSLGGNRFGDVQRKMLPSPSEELMSLGLDDNDLDSIPEDIFSDMPSLNHVSLRDNGIRKLEENTWKGVWEQLDIISLEGNPLECDSHMNWMFNLKVTSEIYGTCETPENQHGKSLKDFIDSGRE